MDRRAFLARPAGADDLAAVGRGLPAVSHIRQDAGRSRATTARIRHFRTEWWYITGWVKDAQGQRLRCPGHFFPQLAPAFRRTTPAPSRRSRSCSPTPRSPIPGWAALRARPARGARRASGWPDAEEGNTDVRIDDWSLRLVGDTLHRPHRFARSSISLSSSSRLRPILLEGDRGFSRKGPQAGAGELLLQPPASRRARQHHGGGQDAAGDRSGVARSRMVQRVSGGGRRGLGLDRDQSVRRRRADGLSHPRQESGKDVWAGGTLRDARGPSARACAERSAVHSLAPLALTSQRHRISGRDARDAPAI